MKRLIAILFLSLYLTTSTEVHELFKLPLLFFHFQEHRTENQALSFLSFLQEHYTGHSEQKTDWQKDSKLPFKTCQNDITHVQWFEPHEFQWKKCTLNFSVEKPSIISNQVILPLEQLNAIWHPPKTLI